MVIVYTIHAVAFIAFIVVMLKFRDAMRRFPTDIDTVLKNHSEGMVAISRQFKPEHPDWISDLGDKLAKFKDGDGILLRAQFNAAKKQYDLGMITESEFKQIVERIEIKHDGLKF